MNVASQELCNELYCLSGWASTHLEYNVDTDELHIGAINAVHSNAYCPAYDLGYLIRKLPMVITTGVDPVTEYLFQMTEGVPDGTWQIDYRDVDDGQYTAVVADTPEDAACKLAIELWKQGALK